MDVSDFYPYIRRYVQGCPDFTIDFALNQTVREFCHKTWYVRRTGFQTFVQNDRFPVIDYNFVNDQEISLAIRAVQYGNIPLQQYMPEEINQSYSTYGYIYYPNNIIELLFDPDIKTQLSINTVISVKQESSYIPDDISPGHVQTIVDGAIYFLLSIPSEQWTNFKLADYYEKRYRAGMLDAKTSAMFGHVKESKMQATNWYI